MFDSQNCAVCHHDGNFTSAEAYDVGLRDEVGKTQFNPPTLRGVSQRNRLFHDNRAESLRDVFTKSSHGLEKELAAQEIDDLIEYLKSL